MAEAETTTAETPQMSITVEFTCVQPAQLSSRSCQGTEGRKKRKERGKKALRDKWQRSWTRIEGHQNEKKSFY